MNVWGEPRRFLTEILYFIFPPTCPGCGLVDTFLCKDCGENLHPLPRLVLPNITASLPYKNKVVKRALWLLKYRGHQNIARIFGRLIFETIFEELADKDAFVNKENYLIVAVPMSEKRLRERGYNHAYLIAKSLKKESGDTLAISESALIKIKETKNQARTKNKSERLVNVKGSMKADEKEVIGKHVLLIDDITTTGATINESIRALKNAGAKSVHAYVVAH